MTYDSLLVTLLFLSLVFWEVLSGITRQTKRRISEWLIDGLGFAQLGLIRPIVFVMAFGLGALLFPEYQNSLDHLPFWLGFLIVFLPDDFTHYWVHRIAHHKAWLWGFHRTHHTPNIYQTSIAFRENWLWFWIMPGFWWTGFMIYAGLLEEALLSSAIIGIHNIWIHNGTNWDLKLYKTRLSRFLMRFFEIFINTPSLHRAHHGLGQNAVPMGNYAQTLFIWDVIFGTAKFTEDNRPEYYGTINPISMEQPWYAQLWWPIFSQQSADIEKTGPLLEKT